ncbi:Bifunctional enzyme IspD/IspF [Sulfitobacter noctilucae]|uniref:2-C-methyl-D-erythritol 4-phosphate cytidylyltransferase n=1 Tax=Sulfitobacter noctilucae TaxID=1342302 RepID=UPI000563C6A6|nr:2-C-methyl-D-erythritol 4-phosphate cytidylyltransferase [Sulfitobacter noctilucae]KIN60124.1 Bifunctional enzyme IspD/IspF [Sulfitobacter noctilucae]
MKVAILIVAAGRGRRFGDPLPKQYLPVAGICALRRCLDTFLGMVNVGTVQVVIHSDDADLYAGAVAGVFDPRLNQPVAGAETRAKSVMRGLLALQDAAPDVVLVHDAARPFVTERIVADVLTALEHADGAFAALPVVDALWQAEDGLALTPVARDGLWRAQTPQGFRFQALLDAHRTYQGDAADDVEIARAMGIDVRIVHGDTANFKITTPEDLARAERFLR